ncbi:structural maintenance of chromosomes protein 2 [Chrysoperla carnea]|uniref:structural maintenance of chromosomes protein 2 n=1 Tax=Chrysoperla carnea TaxID=189513 RepID=UPI001D062381|nr:structural maintenance of chromosomes protein 2 [Chrysoperla carnea]
MYIKNIVLDGFKSYRTRTEVPNFDPEFNAITGLNGSGKSNILDSICFVLGITNLSQVRATQLQDLVFKNGQAGITKATVTITFDNSNPAQCPPGYEQFKEIVITRQVIIGGKNRYLINGSNVQNKRVQDLFCAVQLNVNNPNFLIMQGRITKVLNMKPPEILAMIEEAAGTHMYEVKKQEAERIIEKKDMKLANIVDVLEQDIGPKLTKLKAERQQYLEYQRIEREVEHMNRLFIIANLRALRQNSTIAENNLKIVRDNVSSKQQIIQKNKTRITELENEVKQINEHIDKQSGGKLSKLDEDLQEKRNVEIEADTQLKQLKEAFTSEQKKLKQLEKDFNADKKTLATKEAEFEQFDEVFRKLKEKDANDAAALKDAEKRLEAASTGKIIGSDGEIATSQSQLIAFQQEETEIQTSIQQTEIELKHAVERLKALKQQFDGEVHDLDQDQELLTQLENDVQLTQNALKKLNFNEEKVEDLKERRHNLILTINELKKTTQQFEGSFPRAAFHYSDPEPNFDRRSVLGVACKLISVKNDKFCTALEIAAGSKLYDVVVDTERTGKLLLQRGQLQSRRTIIPMNKINAKSFDANKLRIAQQIAGSDNVFTPISLIDFDSKLQNVMQYIFGQTLIVASNEIGAKLAYDKRINVKCVSVDGDSFDPSGIVSGGAVGAAGQLLTLIKKLSKSMKETNTMQNELDQVEQQLRQMANVAEQHRVMKEKFDFANHKLNLINDRITQSDHYRKQAEIDELQAAVDQMKTRLKESKNSYDQCKKKITNLMKEIENAEKNREKILKDLQKQVQDLKKQADRSKKEWENNEGAYEALKLEIEEMKKSIENTFKEIESTNKTIESSNENLSEVTERVKEAKRVVAEAVALVKFERDEIAKKTKEIQKINGTKKQLVEKNAEIQLEIQQLELELEKLEKDNESCQAEEKRLIDKHEWVVSDTRYTQEVESLTDRQRNELGNQVKQLRDRYAALGRTVNARALQLLETEEELFQKLVKRKKILEDDKKQIFIVIRTLDEKKEKAIVKAWEEVNKNFGSIFSTLLPGTDAKLKPSNPKNILEGLEVKVSFGGVWKESLVELSGGQRSLIALSLILSMLKFKPAPLYILDEVDAALDLSHTQNIGNMLRTHFRNSQFIVVSLKDGMFNNANVLFRTQFVEGVSTVNRTECRRSKK